MTISARVAADVNSTLEERHLGRSIASARSIGGGCIHQGSRIETDAGAVLFLKWNEHVLDGTFEAEADGLAALAAASALRVPEVVAWAERDGAGWLLLEYVEPGRATSDTDAAFGRGLAALHTRSGKREFGWRRNNWIGSLPQDNTGTAAWADFWRDRRIAPQLERARRLGHLRDRVFDDVLDVIPGGLAEVTHPELVHGDLWSGNWLVGEKGDPVLIDPAVYLGHGEVDLAMSELFGGFGPSFYEAYDGARGIPTAYHAYRRDLYQLYYLLVHVNLFGGSYVGGALEAARRVVAELRD